MVRLSRVIPPRTTTAKPAISPNRTNPRPRKDVAPRRRHRSLSSLPIQALNRRGSLSKTRLTNTLNRPILPLDHHSIGAALAILRHTAYASHARKVMQPLHLGGRLLIKLGARLDDHYRNIVTYGPVPVTQHADQSPGDPKVPLLKDGAPFLWEGCAPAVEAKDVEEEVGNEEASHGGFLGGVLKDKGDVLHAETDVIGRGRAQVIVEDINAGVAEADALEFVAENVDTEAGLKELAGDQSDYNQQKLILITDSGTLPFRIFVRSREPKRARVARESKSIAIAPTQKDVEELGVDIRKSDGFLIL